MKYWNSEGISDLLHSKHCDFGWFEQIKNHMSKMDKELLLFWFMCCIIALDDAKLLSHQKYDLEDCVNHLTKEFMDRGYSPQQIVELLATLAVHTILRLSEKPGLDREGLKIDIITTYLSV